MAKLVWDKTGERTYQTGIDRVVMYPYKDGKYTTGAAWNGVNGVDESPSGGEPTAYYANNKKYLNVLSAEDYGATVTAYTSPEEFDECDGTKEIVPGVYMKQQDRVPFGLTYRSLVGNDSNGTAYGYKIHLVYNCLAKPSSVSHSTVNDSPDLEELSWELSTTPVEVEGFNPTAHIVIDSTRITSDNLKTLEDKLYGTADTEATLPTPEELIALFGGKTTASSVA